MNKEKLVIDRLIIVEGRYDKIKLENIVSADIFAVNGFSVFKDKATVKTIKELAKSRGVLLLTDSDVAGYKIRVYLEKILTGVDIVNVFIPQLRGKEKRKSVPSKQGYLGVEGVSDECLYNALVPYTGQIKVSSDIDVALLYTLGYTGVFGAKEYKNKLLKHIGVQSDISNKFLLRILNERYTKEEFIKLSLELKEV